MEKGQLPRMSPAGQTFSVELFHLPGDMAFMVLQHIENLREQSGQMFWPVFTLQSGFYSAAVKVC